MKKKYLYIVWVSLLIGLVGFVVIKYEKETNADANAAYVMLPRKNGLQKNGEWAFAKQNIDLLLNKLKSNPSDIKSMISLSNAYVAESRISGNTAYYDKAAMQMVDKALSRDANNFEALSLKALLFLSQHHFAEGLATAEAAQKINPDNSFIYGLLVDGNVEMGNYAAAVDAADKMVTLRPDLRSYSRIAYLREIHGDYPGAAEAMHRAVNAGAAGQESTEWCRVQLGRIFENMGETEKAVFQYRLSLAARPGYAYAYSGLGRIAAFEKKYDSAAIYYSKADSLVNDFGIRENLALNLKYMGKEKQSEDIYDRLVTDMTNNSKIENSNEDIGHYADREMAYVFINTNDYDKALLHATAEYNRRPKNIDVNETLGWVYYKKKDYSKARLFIDKAFATNSQSPVLLCTAGLIYAASGEKVKAHSYLTKGMENNPVLPVELKAEAEKVKGSL